MGSVEGEKYCLKWNDFTSNLSTAFQQLRKDEDFFDVTLLTEDSEIKCHKLVLGACSSHFRQIIKRLSSIQNPAIYLRGVRHEDIKNILEFMYLGEVNIAHEDLDSFLAVAQDLCIKGLTQDNNTSQNHETPSQTPMGSGSRSPAPSKRPREPKPDRGQPPSKTPKREQLVQLKQEPQQHHEAIAIDHNIVIDNANDDEGNIEAYDEYYDEEATLDNPTVDDDNKGEDDQEELSIEIHEYLSSMSGRTEEGRYRCLICGQTCRDLYNQREHLMTHMVRDEKFKSRLEKFMRSNVTKDLKNNTTCLICRTPVTCNVRKHFLSKHLREPKSNYVQLPDESF